MFKKILYVVSVALIGITVVFISLFATIANVLEDFMNDKVANGEYTFVESYYARSIDQENKYYAEDLENGVHIEVFSAINFQIFESDEYKDSDGNPQKYKVFENTIEFAIFNLPESFDLADYKDSTKYVQGGVMLSFEGTAKTVFFPFNDTTKVDRDHYTDLSIYSFLPLTIYENEYTTALRQAGLSTDAKIVGATIYDGKHDQEDTYTITFENNPTFDSEFYTNFAEFVSQYNALQLKSLAGETVADEELNPVLSLYTKIVEDNGYAMFTSYMPFDTFEFIFPMILIGVLYTASAVAIGWFIFRKKKAPAYKPQAKKTTTVKPQPEQFTRDVFNVEEDDVEVKDEEVVEEAKEETSNE